MKVAKAKDKVNAIGFLSHLSTVFAIDNRYAEIVYAPGGRAFRISADDVESLGFSSDGKRAELRATADLWDHTRILRPVRVGRDLTLQISLTEGSKGGQGHDRLLALGRRHARPRAAREGAGRGVRRDPLGAIRDAVELDGCAEQQIGAAGGVPLDVPRGDDPRPGRHH